MHSPIFLPFSVWGLFIGCIVANLISAYGVIDIVFGSLATVLAALCTMVVGKKSCGGLLSKVLACLPPVLFNAVIVGALIAFYSTGLAPAFWPLFLINALWVGLGELLALYALGLPALIFLPKTQFFGSLSRIYTP
jgi:uncharacterized membrane protein